MAETEEFFSTPEAVARLDLIRHLIENSELVPLVRGPSGSGKTLLASRLQSLAPDNWVICHFTADAMMQPERLLAYIARCSGLADGEGRHLDRINERFEQLRKHGDIPVLLVDDAQTLPPTSLITLLRLYERQVDGAPLVSLVLFANEDIDKLLSTPQLQIMSPQAIQVIDLPLLTRDEADAFMRYLFKSEDLEDKYLLDDAKLTRLYRETGGVPGQLATAILTTIGGDQESVSTSIWHEKKALFYRAIPLIAVALLLLIFQGPINRLFEPAEDGSDHEPPQIVDIHPPEMKAEESGVVAYDGKKLAEPELPPFSGLTAGMEDERESAKSGPASVVESTLPEPEVTAAEPGTDAEAQSHEPEKEMASVEMQESDPVQSVHSETVVEEVSGEGVADAVDTEKVQSKPQDDNLTAKTEPEPTAPISDDAEIAAMEGIKPSSPGKAVSVMALSATKGRDWVESQPPGNYTLQLLAAGNIKSIQGFIKKHGLSGEAFTIQTQRNGKPWYPLLWGAFPDRDSALGAVKQLPPAVQSGGAWARSFASLQK